MTVIQGKTLTILWTIMSRRCPSLRDIGRETGIPYATVDWHVQKLVREGLAAYEPHKIGTLRPTCRFIPENQLQGEPT